MRALSSIVVRRSRGWCCRRIASSAATMKPLTEDEHFRFDLHGYVVIRNALTAEEVEDMNRAIDAHSEDFLERKEEIRNARDEIFSDSSSMYSGRLEHGRFLEEWEAKYALPFRSLLAHPNLAGKIQALCGEGYRLDHMPLLMRQLSDVEGFDLHGGRLNKQGVWNRELAYHFEDGRSYCSLLAMSVQLTATRRGDGGFCVVPGSHKANLPTPSATKMESPILQQPEMSAGDVLLFSEATIHGALPWRGISPERRIALYRFAPSNHAFGRGVWEQPWSETMLAELTPSERCVLAPPYNRGLGREILENRTGEPVVTLPRNERKKAFDEALYGRGYY